MLGKKDKRLVDLEFMIPKEFKDEAVLSDYESSPGRIEISESIEYCHSCSRPSDETMLLPVFHQGIDKWVCPKCLKKELSEESATPPYGLLGGMGSEVEKTEEENYGYSAAEDSLESYGSESEEKEDSNGGMMSMFD